MHKIQYIILCHMTTKQSAPIGRNDLFNFFIPNPYSNTNSQWLTKSKRRSKKRALFSKPTDGDPTHLPNEFLHLRTANGAALLSVSISAMQKSGIRDRQNERTLNPGALTSETDRNSEIGAQLSNGYLAPLFLCSILFEWHK